MQQMNETITVNRVYKETKKRKSTEVYSDEQRDTLEVRTFNDVPVAKVSFRAGLTKNLGDFNSANVSVEVTLPSYVEEIDEAMAQAQLKVDEALAPALGEFVELLQAKGLVK